MTATKRQQRELSAAIAHIGRAMKALDRSGLVEADSGYSRFALREGSRRLGRASDSLIHAATLLHHEANPGDRPVHLFEVHHLGTRLRGWLAVDEVDAIRQQIECEREELGDSRELEGDYQAYRIGGDSWTS